MDSFDRLVEVMQRLRAPEGCPWDREQTHASLRRYLLEEAYETLEALDQGEDAKLCEELGDLLLQIVFHAVIAAEREAFDIDDVCRGIADKLIRRHPHVFGAVTGVDRAEDVWAVWEQQKQAERDGVARESALDGVPRDLPALARSFDVQRRASRVGFDWPDLDSRLQKVHEELAELDHARQAGDPAAVEEEFGDLLFILVNIGRSLGVGAEDALRSATDKFVRRFREMERAAGGAEAFAALDLQAQDQLWNDVKAGEAKGPDAG